MKPNGLSMTMTEGRFGFSVSIPTHTEDAIWNAVETAIGDGWDPTRFRREVAEAWRQRLRDDAADIEKKL